jgi:hypothetical protein
MITTSLSVSCRFNKELKKKKLSEADYTQSGAVVTA